MEACRGREKQRNGQGDRQTNVKGLEFLPSDFQ